MTTISSFIHGDTLEQDFDLPVLTHFQDAKIQVILLQKDKVDFVNLLEY